jgi:acyl-CoA oxidase
MTSKDIQSLQETLEASLKKLRYNALGICEGFDYPDAILNSVLGTHDGNVYENLINAAMKSPLNQEDVNQSFHSYLKPFMKSNL